MTDEISLAVQTVALVGPYLSALLAGAASTVGQESVKGLWAKIKAKLSKTASGQEALADLEVNPTSRINLNSLETSLAKELSKDPGFLKEITELLKQAGSHDESMNQNAEAGAGSFIIQNQTKK